MSDVDKQIDEFQDLSKYIVVLAQNKSTCATNLSEANPHFITHEGAGNR